MRCIVRPQKCHAIAFGLAIVWSASAAGQEPYSEGVTVTLNEVVSFPANPTPPGVQWSWTVQELGTKFLRVRFAEIEDASINDYAVLIRDRNGDKVQTIPKAEFRAQGDFWSKLLEGDYARIEVLSDAPPIGLTFKLAELAFQRPKAVVYSIVGGGLESISAYKNVAQLYGPSRAIAKLSFVMNRNSYTCTGFLINDNSMLTNQHCIGSNQVCATAVALFGYEIGDNGQLNFGQQYRCLSVIDFDISLDVALIKLEGDPGMTWGHLELTRRALDQDEQAFVIQHPGGQPKQIARNKCYLSTLIADGRAPMVDVGHKCDTAEGSSGSPILGQDYKVVGLHHWGFKDDDCRWAGENRGIRMVGIMDRMKLP
jgi:V8-like Glu-specific endopeptidase